MPPAHLFRPLLGGGCVTVVYGQWAWERQPWQGLSYIWQWGHPVIVGLPFLGPHCVSGPPQGLPRHFKLPSTFFPYSLFCSLQVRRQAREVVECARNCTAGRQWTWDLNPGLLGSRGHSLLLSLLSGSQTTLLLACYLAGVSGSPRGRGVS